jgi:hypothetical protein
MSRWSLYAVLFLIAGCIPPSDPNWQSSQWPVASDYEDDYGSGSAQPNTYDADSSNTNDPWGTSSNNPGSSRNSRDTYNPRNSNYPRNPRKSRDPYTSRNNSGNSGGQLWWMCTATASFGSAYGDGPMEYSSIKQYGNGPTKEKAYLMALENCHAAVSMDTSLANASGKRQDGGTCTVVDCFSGR